MASQSAGPRASALHPPTIQAVTNLPPYVRTQSDGAVLIALKVQPRASRNEIGEVLGNELKIKITAPPVDSAANEALLGFLAEKLECPKGALRLARGQTSRHKIVAITGVDAAEVVRRLLPKEA
jgi:uncharacterized protein (TIGR00251 family)